MGDGCLRGYIKTSASKRQQEACRRGYGDHWLGSARGCPVRLRDFDERGPLHGLSCTMFSASSPPKHSEIGITLPYSD
jgi:hypothetical protein